MIQTLCLINWLLVLPAELESEADRMIAEIEGAATMPYVTSIERRAEERGRKEGRLEGREEGRAEGKEEGLRDGLLEALELGLELRFGKSALRVIPRVRGIADLERLRELKAALIRAAGIEEFESILANR